MARKRSRSRPRAKVRTRTRTIVKYRARRAARGVKRLFRRRRGGGGGSGGLPFRTGGSILDRVKGSIVPVTKTVVPIVVGAVGGAMLAKALEKRLKTPIKIGLGVTAAAIVVGSFAGKAGKGLARTVAFAAVGMAADGVMRVLAPARAAGKIPLLPRGNAGLLAGASSQGDEMEMDYQFVPTN